MRRAALAFVCILLVVSQVPHHAIGLDSRASNEVQSSDVIERTVRAHGTQYHISVNTSNHTVTISAVHLADNETAAGYSVHLNGNRVLDQPWEASKGDTSRTQAFLMYEYDATKTVRTIMFSTYRKRANLTYNFTVPRKYEGRYLRPTITDVEFERINRTWGRMTVTVRSDAPYYYGAYVVVWTPEIDRKKLYMHRTKGENVTRESFLLPVSAGEPFEGEIRLHPGGINESGPLHTQYEFYGRPGQESLREVEYEPLGLNEIREYSYENESRQRDSPGAVERTLDAHFRTVLAGLAGFAVLVIVVGVVLAQRRRV